jgi:hypothetical protein
MSTISLYDRVRGGGGTYTIVDDGILQLYMVLACLRFHDVLSIQDSVSWCQLIKGVEKSP